jgi:hypothetical protein
MVIKILAFETLGKLTDLQNSHLNPLGCSACSPAHALAAAVFPSLGLHAMSGQGTACSLSAVLKVCQNKIISFLFF